MDDSPWPTARLSKGGANGHAQLVPPVIENEPLLPPKETERWVQVMWKQREELSDLDADALDLLCHFWLEQAKRPEDAAVAHIDEFLEMRGLKKNQSGSGRRGGYKQEQRLEMLRALSHIQSIWLKMGQIEIYEESDKPGAGRANSTLRKSQGRKRQPVTKQIESRAFVVTDRLGQLNMDGYMEVEQFKYRPGDLFAHFLLGPGRQTAIMSAKAVQYDPYRQKWEKRLARYLSWQWRIQASRTGYSRPYRVNTLLEVVGEENGPQRPHLIRNRLEKALDCLQEDKLIASWQYERWDEEMGGRPGWLQNWREATLLIEPPATIAESYRSLEKHQETAANRRLPQAERAENIVQQLKEKRKKLGISQRDCAVELGCGQGFLSKLESGVAKPSEQLLERIKEWLASK
jgi:DNA-binding transcriptional regulator YiaG